MDKEHQRNETQSSRCSRQLLERFLSSAEFQEPRPASTTWEQNPLVQELVRSLRTEEDLQYIEDLLGDEDCRHKALITTLQSLTSSGTISSSRGSEATLLGSTSEASSSSSSSLHRSFKSTLRLSQDENKWSVGRASSSSELHGGGDEDEDDEDQDQDEDEGDGDQISAVLNTKMGILANGKSSIQGFRGLWDFKKSSDTDLTHLHRIMDLDKGQIRKRLEQDTSFEILLDEDFFSVKTNIIGLCNVKLPLSGEATTTSRFDELEGCMEVHVEAKRSGLRMIYTWGHPLGGTRRDTFTLSCCEKKLTIVAYITRRDGNNCKAKWGFTIKD